MEKNRNGYTGWTVPEAVVPKCRGEEENGVQLAMVYAPRQEFVRLYSPAEALKRGTLFEELDKPLEVCR